MGENTQADATSLGFQQVKTGENGFSAMLYMDATIMVTTDAQKGNQKHFNPKTGSSEFGKFIVFLNY